MRFYGVLPLTAALASAFVLPDEHVMNDLAIEDNRPANYFAELKNSFQDAVETSKTTIEATVDDVSQTANQALDTIYEWIDEKESETQQRLDGFGQALKDAVDYAQEKVDTDKFHAHLCGLKETANEWREDLGLALEPHRGPPRRGGPDKFRRPYGDDPRDPVPPPPPGPPEEDDHHHGKPPHHKKPHHGKPPHHHKPNHTVYELINKSKYTTKFAELVNKFPDVVKRLNSTKGNVTVFAPTDKAFEKIPEHGKKPSKEFLEAILAYHIVNDFYPAGRVLGSRTVASALSGPGLSEVPHKTPQRISIHLGFRGLTLNFYSRVIAINIFGTNGVIHGIDSILVPPPKAAKVIQFLPSEFSTLELGLFKTGLFGVLNDTSNHLGGTLFAPTNSAFQKLGPRANGFLFSKFGRKYLKALLEYHVVPNITLYSDALYTAHKSKDSSEIDAERTFHIDLPTLLKDKYLSIDVAHWSRFLDIRINGFNHASVIDGIAKDGVIHIPGNVIIPPKGPSGAVEVLDGEIEVEDLKARLEPFVKDDEDLAEDDFEFVHEEQKPLDGFSFEL